MYWTIAADTAASTGTRLRIRYGSQHDAVAVGVPPACIAELQPTRLPLQKARFAWSALRATACQRGPALNQRAGCGVKENWVLHSAVSLVSPRCAAAKKSLDISDTRRIEDLLTENSVK